MGTTKNSWKEAHGTDPLRDMEPRAKAMAMVAAKNSWDCGYGQRPVGRMEQRRKERLNVAGSRAQGEQSHSLY